MAIECNACGKPVHETVVRCPHCGDQTGVPVDPIAAAEVSLLPEPPPRKAAEPLPYDRLPPKPPRPPRPKPLPRAIARKRRRG